MAKSEDTFIPLKVNDREQALEDLAFLSDQRNYKSIKYAIECIDKLEKIEQIVKKELSPLSIDEMSKAEIQIREVLENE